MTEEERREVLDLAEYLAGPLASSVDLEVAMKLRAVVTGDRSEVEARERRLAALAEREDE